MTPTETALRRAENAEISLQKLKAYIENRVRYGEQTTPLSWVNAALENIRQLKSELKGENNGIGS